MGSTSTDDNIAIALIILTMSILLWVCAMVSKRADELKLRAHAVSSAITTDATDNGILYCGYTNSLYDDGLSSDKIQNFFLGSATSVLPDLDAHAPVSEYSPASCSGGQCVICLENFNAKCNLRIPRVCGHAMHAKCAELWLVDTARNSCPTCMARVVPTRDADMRHTRQTTCGSS